MIHRRTSPKSGKDRSDILSLLLPREVYFLGKHSCQGHTAAIRHERASPKPIVSKTGKRQARICKGVLKVSFPGESEPWKNLWYRAIYDSMPACCHGTKHSSLSEGLRLGQDALWQLAIMITIFHSQSFIPGNPLCHESRGLIVSRYHGLWNSAWKRYRSARPKDGSREDGSCNLVLASRRIKATTKPTVWQFTYCSVLVLDLIFFLVRPHFMLRVHGEPWICIPSCSTRVSRGSFPTTARSVTQGPL